MTNKIINNDPCNEKLLFLLLLTLETVQGSDDKVYPSLHVEYLPSTLHVWQSSVSSTLLIYPKMQLYQKFMFLIWSRYS